jgi:hypothetical protein
MGSSVDLIVTAVVAVLVMIVAVLVAIIRKKKIGRILLYGILGLVVGLPAGYSLAPTIISFF